MDPIARFLFALPGFDGGPDLPVLEAYGMVAALVPVFATILVTVLCAFLFALMLALGIGFAHQGLYTLGLFGLLVAVQAAGSRVTRAVGRRRRALLVPLPRAHALGLPPADIGFKASNLTRLIDVGIWVAQGWVVTADAFERHARKNGISVDPDDRETARRVLEAPVSRRLLRRLHRALLSVPQEHFLLRSSFFDEDRADRAFPGVYESLPWHRDDGRDALEQVLKSIWASYWSERAIDYRRSAPGEAHHLTRLAVLINITVEHELCGFASSADVSNGSRDIHLIDIATPENEHTLRHDLLENTIHSVQAHEGPPLPTPIALRISRFAGTAEQLLGRPAEIEWGLRDGQIWIYQARALTALPEVETFTNSYVAELPRFRMTPLSRAFLFGGDHPARTLGVALAWLGLPPLTDEDAVIIDGAPYVRWRRFKSNGSLPATRGLPPRGILRVLRVIVMALLARPWRGYVIPAPPGGPSESNVGALVARLRTLRAERLLPRVERQARVFQVASMLDVLLRQLSPKGKSPIPIVPSPMDAFHARLGSDDAGGASFADAVAPVWYLADREAEISARRAIDDPEDFARRLRPTAPISTDLPLAEAVRPSFGMGLLVRARNRLLIEREQLNVELNATAYEARIIAEALSAALSELHPTWETEDVYWLDLDEHEALARAEAEAGLLLERARARRDAAVDGEVIRSVIRRTADGRILEDARSPAGEDGRVSGIPLGGGRVQGPALIVAPGSSPSPAEAAGTIVILPDPSPIWTAIAASAAGVVLRSGGPLSHLAIWCRERGIPTIAAARQADLLARDGETVELDADVGELRRV